MPAGYQLLNPWPEKALDFTTSVERVARLIARARSGMASHYDLTLPGWRMLRLVEQSGSRATRTRLARRLNVARPSARETADRLREIGYLSIGRSAGDRRARLLAVTDAGVECLSEVEGVIQFLLLEMTNDLPAAWLESAARTLDRMAKRLGECETVLRGSPRRRATR
jgi:DNA-binding MarR family transcriptional regulator